MFFEKDILFVVGLGDVVLIEVLFEEEKWDEEVVDVVEKKEFEGI